MIARVFLGAAALGAAALFGLWIASSKAEERANRVAFSSPAQVRAQLTMALEDARDARVLVPDGPAKAIEWRLLYEGGRRERAARLLDDMLHEEPENAGLWLILLSTTGDRARAREARDRLRELNPALVGRGG